MGFNDHIVLTSPLPSPLVSTPLVPHLPKPNATLSSSPDLPSASQVLAKWKEYTVSGSKANQAPKGTAAEFTTAASLLTNDYKSASGRAGPVADHTALKTIEPPLLRTKDKSAHAESGERKVGHKTRSSKKLEVATTKETISHEKFEIGAEAPRNAEAQGKRRCRKKSTENGQTKISKTKVTKPGGTVKLSNSSKKVLNFNALLGDGEAFSRMLEELDDERRVSEGNLNLCLDEAIRRRQRWTPTKDTPKEITCSKDTEPAIVSSFSSNITTDAPIPLPYGFGNKLSGFGFEKHVLDKSARPTLNCSLNGEALTKKRKLELVSGVVTQSPLSILTKKASSMKKKPQTITAKASAPFISEKEPTTTIQKYFGSSTTGSADSLRNEKPSNQHLSVQSDKQQLPTKKVKSRSSPILKMKKSIQEAPVVLSPKAAMKTAHEQDVIFGTSSQLERDESPAFTRELQCAIKESEAVEAEKCATPNRGNTSFASSISSNSINIRLHAASRDLWSVAARDIEGSLLRAEVVNLTESPLPRSRSAKTNKTPVPDKPTSNQPAANSTSEWQSIDTPVHIGSSKPPKTQLQVLTEESSIPKSVAEASLKERPRSRSPVKQKRPRKGSKASTCKPVSLEMPKYKGYTTNDLKIEVKSNGFKPIRRREEMIALLERCWESRNRAALQSLPPNVKLSMAPVEKLTAAAEGPEDDPSESKYFPIKGVKAARKTARAAMEDVDMTAPTPPTRKKKESEVALSAAP
ncbi:MAG: hypothetical protein Q9167_006660 [Letrouitia subvulpina]